MHVIWLHDGSGTNSG